MRGKKFNVKKIMLFVTIALVVLVFRGRIMGLVRGLTGGVSGVNPSGLISGVRNQIPGQSNGQQQRSQGQQQSRPDTGRQNDRPVNEGQQQFNAGIQPSGISSSGQCTTVQSGSTYSGIKRQMGCNNLVDKTTGRPPPNINVIQVGQNLCCQ